MNRVYKSTISLFLHFGASIRTIEFLPSGSGKMVGKIDGAVGRRIAEIDRPSLCGFGNLALYEITHRFLVKRNAYLWETIDVKEWEIFFFFFWINRAGGERIILRRIYKNFLLKFTRKRKYDSLKKKWIFSFYWEFHSEEKRMKFLSRYGYVCW